MISPNEYMGVAKTAMPSPDEYMGIKPIESVIEKPIEVLQRPSSIVKPAIQTAKGMLYDELPEGLGYLQKPLETAVDYWGQFFMSPKEEQAMQAKHPTLMATRYAAASLLLPGVSEKFASPTEMAEFAKKSPQEQRVEITGLAATYAAFGAATRGASALAIRAAKKYPWLTEPIGKLLKDSNWYRRATIKERGLVVQSVDDMLTAGLNEAQVLKSLKKSGNLKEFNRFKTEAIKTRMKAEPIITPEQFLKTKPIIEKPAPIEPTAELAREPVAIEKEVAPEKAMPKKVYHGTVRDFDELDFGERYTQGIFGEKPSKAKVIFFSEKKEHADYFRSLRGEGGRILEKYISEDAKIADFTGLTKSKDVVKAIELIESIDKEWGTLIDEGEAEIQGAFEDSTFIENLKKAGYDGGRFVEPEKKGITIAIIDKDKVLAEYPDLAPAKPQPTAIPTEAKPEALTKEFKGEGIPKPIMKPSEFMKKEFKPEPMVDKVTPAQIKASHAIAREKGWLSEKGKVKPQYRRLAKAFTGKSSIAKMTKTEASEFISALKKVPVPEFVSGRIKVASIPLSKDITPKDFFKREFKEPSLIKIITPSNRYAYTLGVSELIEPSIKARTAMLNERKDQFDMLDKTRNLINKVGKTSIAERKWSRLRNKPTKSEVRMWESLDKFKTANGAGLTGKEANIFTELRNLTDVMLERTNEVRAKVDLEPINSMRAYVTHISDAFTKKGLAEKYPFPEEVRYWLDFINPKHIYNPTAFKRMVEQRPGLLKDPIKALKAMVSMDLKQIYLEQPNMLFREQMKAFKGIMPASTRQWVQAYMNEVVKGMPTKLDNLTNASLDKLGITRMIDFALKPFGRTLSYNPIKDITGQISRVVHDATIWGKIRLVVRNHTQKFLTLGLYDTKAFAKAMLPASKELKVTVKQNDFWKISRQQFMERLPEGMFGKLEKLGFKPYGHSHISNVTFSMKTAYYASKELVDNPKYKSLGWTEKDVQKEMEFGAMTTQYWYNLMGMPEIYRSGLSRVFAVLQSWWQNYATNYWREMISRAWYGKTGWGKPIPVKWRLGALRHIITSIAFIEGTKRAFGLDYRRIALLGTLPAYLSPPGQIVLGLYNYVSATDEYGRKKAINQLKWSWSAFVPGSGAWRDFIKTWREEMTAKELFFYKEREKKRKKLKGFGKLKGLGGLK